MGDLMVPTRGWWNMTCWNGLSDPQQRRLIEHGNLPIDYRPEGTCPNGAEVAIETDRDEAPGPRFYCRACAITHLAGDARAGVASQPVTDAVLRGWVQRNASSERFGG